MIRRLGNGKGHIGFEQSTLQMGRTPASTESSSAGDIVTSGITLHRASGAG